MWKNDAHFRGFCVPLLGTCQKISLSLKFFVCGETLFVQQRWYEDSITFAFAWPVGVNEALVINNRHFNIHSHLIQWDLFFRTCVVVFYLSVQWDKKDEGKPSHHTSHTLSIFPSFYPSMRCCLFSISHADFFQEESPKHLKKLATSDSDDHINNTHSFPSLS